MNPPASGNNPHRRRRRFSWTYDEDHHIGQYSDENTLLAINENYSQLEDEEGNSYDSDECETDQDAGMDLCEPENGEASRYANPEGTQQLQIQKPSNGIGRRRRRPLRKVLGKAWETPSPAVMQGRNRFRQIVDDETRRHRRILPNSATESITEARPQNIFHLLRDRELFGGGSSNGGIRSTTSQGMGSSNGTHPRFRIGVPILVHPDSEDERSAKGNKRTRHGKRSRKQKNDDGANEPSLKDEDATTNATSIVLNKYKQRHTTEELRSYAEHVCVTKFESSYLSHLQHDEQPLPEAPASNDSGNGTTNNDGASNADANGTSNSNSNQNQQNLNTNTNSKAVSTISIAFAPDGKTMASTHGDHTVKITCCMTGKLLQTLVGHPRTPWTVKYHPHAGADLKNPKTKKVIIANRTANTNSTYISSQEDSSQQRQEYEQQQEQQIVASGCLGHQVRIWDWVSGTCLQMIRLEYAIISLSFHPEGNCLAVANGTRLHFWALPTVNKAEETNKENTPAANAIVEKDRNTATGGNNTTSMIRSNNATNSTNATSQQPRRGGGMHIEMRHMLRCVHFLPDGKRIIVGGVNPQSAAEARRRREGNQDKAPSMSFYLRLWDFDLEASLGLPRTEPSTSTTGITSTTQSSISSSIATTTTSQHQAILESTQAAAAAAAAARTNTRRRRPIGNPRNFVPRALLYNDGGFDVSPDGKTLCACAEYWLPDGVDNATDLLHPPESDDYYKNVDYDSSSDESSSDEESDSGDGDKDASDVTMDDVSGDDADKQGNYADHSMNKIDKNDKSTGIGASINGKEGIAAIEKTTEESKSEINVNSPAPTFPHPNSATPPRTSGRPPPQISSPPLAPGTAAPPQTPPPNVNPLNFPLSPPSPPGRRFAGGLTRGSQPPSQQHDQLLQQYNRQQAVLNQQRLTEQQNMPPPQNQQVPSTPPSQGTENASGMIPAPPRINHRNNRQHRLHNQKSLENPGNPFGRTSRSARVSSHPNAEKGRFVPHVVTISLDTEPYIETTTEEVEAGQDVLSAAHSDTAMATDRIRSTTVASTSKEGGNSNTRIVRKTTYNIPGRVPGRTPDFNATRPHALERRPRLGQLLSACPLDSGKASAVTCVKFSPCTDFCLIGYGVREPHVDETNGDGNDSPSHPPYHPVTAMYKVNKGGKMRHVSTMLSGDDDVNISRFHPDSGYGFVYGTKQGRIRILGPRPWNYYNC